ncbi:MAG TPA: DNA damage-inducible protein D [bacterium]|nr:DNA damage-inducible protein D [bacterium]
MKKELISGLTKTFEEYAFEENGVEFWFARDLQKLLGYSEWRNFRNAVDKAKISCKNNGFNVADHFVDINKTIKMPKGAEKEIDDVLLTRYACYLTAQNGDPKKDEIAFAQGYFALQTRKQELVEERIALNERVQARQKLIETETELSRNIYERGVDDKGFGRIRSKGDNALFGGLSTIEMKKKIKVPETRPLADFLPTITIKAKDLAAEITNFNLNKNDLHGEENITSEHVKNNLDVRDLLGRSGIKPEELPAEEDIKKVERKLKTSVKKLGKV